MQVNFFCQFNKIEGNFLDFEIFFMFYNSFFFFYEALSRGV